MEYRSLGRCGPKVSALGLGGWTTFGGSVTDEAIADEIITKAYESGVNFFDIADVYSRGASETLMGKSLKKFPRHRLVISSKVYWPMSDDINDRGLSRKHILESVEKSLKRIGTDYLDMYFCHRWDDLTPLEETLRAMDDLVHQGKVLYWGTSEWSGEQIEHANDAADRRGWYRPQVEQPQFSLLARKRFENDVRPVTTEKGMGVVVWSPLASGFLSGKYDDGVPEGTRLAEMEWLKDLLLNEKNLERTRKMKVISDALGVTRSELAIAWALAQPGVSSVILGARTPKQLDENLAARRLKLEASTLAQLDELFPAD
jgi:voltage-dependent potassium channel beta subunit